MNREALNHRPTVAHGSPALRQGEHDLIAAKTRAFLRSGHSIEEVPSGMHGEDYCGKKPQPGHRNKC